MFNFNELVLIKKSLFFYKNMFLQFSNISFVQENAINKHEDLIEANNLIEKLEIELTEEEDNITKCDECHNHINQNEDIFIDSYSFSVDRPLVICCDCYENIYKLMYKNKK